LYCFTGVICENAARMKAVPPVDNEQSTPARPMVAARNVGLDGIGTLVLGILMLSQWPPASPEIIGALIGISLMLSALSRLIFTMAIRALNPATA
jgi:hypothetical protein